MFFNLSRYYGTSCSAAAVRTAENFCTRVWNATRPSITEPLQGVDPNIDTHKRKVSHVGAVQCSRTKRRRLRCSYYPRPHATGIQNTALKYETKAEAVGDADYWTSEVEKPMQRRSLSPKHGESTMADPNLLYSSSSTRCTAAAAPGVGVYCSVG